MTDATPELPRLPVPLAVISQFLQQQQQQQQQPGGAEAGAGESAAFASTFASAPPGCCEVEVEAKQGYVYTGKLLAVDAFYNFTLADTTVRRWRSCDLERHLIREKYAALSGLVDLPDEMLERPGGPTAPHYLGPCVLRSNNIVMVRFLAPATSDAGRNPADKSLLVKLMKRTDGTAARREHPLASAFRSTATVVKKELQRQRQKNRLERRQRVAAAKVKPA